MKRTTLKRLLPVLVTIVTVIVCILGFSATANDDFRTGQITNASIVLDNNVDLVFWADISESTAQGKNTYMTFNDGSAVEYSGMKSVGDTTYAVYKYSDIMPKDLSQKVTAKLYVEDTLSSVTVFSVKEYCQALLINKNASAGLKTILSDLLVYGAAAQALNGEDPANYVTAGVKGLTPSQNHSDKAVVFGSEKLDNLARTETVTVVQSQISFTNGVEISFDLSIPEGDNPEDYVASLVINGREQEYKLHSYDLSPDGSNYRVRFNNIYAHEFFDNARMNVYKDNMRVSKTVSFSLAPYVDALNDNSRFTAITDAYYNLAYALHTYADAHVLKMPGQLTADGVGKVGTDDSGMLKYTCPLCDKVLAEAPVTHIRDFDNAYADGSPENYEGEGDLFTLATKSEEVSGGSSNAYLSITREEANTNEGGFGYQITSTNALFGIVNKYLDRSGQFSSKKFTLSFDVKAPSEGLANFTLYLRNSNTTSSGRYGMLLDIRADGSLYYDNTRVSPAGTVNADKWTNVTVAFELYYTKEGVARICAEYYVDNLLVKTLSLANTMHQYTFTQLYFAAETTNLTNGQGIHFDNFVFAQDCAHAFNGNVASVMSNLSSGDVRELVEAIRTEFDQEDFSYVVRWSVGSKRTYKEKQGLKGCPTTTYPAPEVAPTSYQHPRLLFNTSDIPRIVSNLEDPKNEMAYETFMDKVTRSITGILPETDKTVTNATHGVFENTNYSASTLTTIEAKALYYALYKNDASEERSDALLRGYEAVYAMKNYLLTFDVQWDMSDQCRLYGEAMYYSAIVYDWCYDLLTEDDKIQFMLGVQNLCCDGTSNAPWLGQTHEGRKLEGGFPALAVEAQTPLTGHGAESQVLRNYFAFSIAIYDEDPTWYQYVGGMLYTNYVDARNYFYSSSFYPDGSAGYNVYRFLCDLYNAWLFKGMGVQMPYNEKDMATVIHGLMAMETSNGYLFATADGSGASNGTKDQYRFGGYVGYAALVSSYLFQDDVALAISNYVNGEFRIANDEMAISIGKYVILTSLGLEPAENYNEYVDRVEYHGGFQQQIISRSDKTEDAAVVLMQGAQHYPGGHTHQNAGSFQIWYKGMLSRDDGLYDAYGSDHHFFYHMSATAHNTLLIYNNNYTNNPLGPSNKVGYYNGGQKYELGIPVSFNNWKEDDKFSYGKLLGMEYDDDQNPSYIYFANDITNAYDSLTVDYVERSFITLYTGDEETPMVMFIFDNITSASADFQKTFLLQCSKEPQINGNMVTVDNGEGKMVLTSLKGADDIKAYGRTSKNGVVGEGNGEERFYLSGAGVNLLPGGATSIGDKSSDLLTTWGHVEVRPEANSETHHLMNVIYVSDSGTVVSETPTLVEASFLTGATFKNATTMFVNDPMHSSDEMTFVTTGEGTMKYYIGGLSEGDWKVSVNGVEIGKFEATLDGKLLTFEAEPGTVVLTPGSNIRPAGTSVIYYNANGGKMPEDYPSYYFWGEGTQLPTPTKKNSTFEGWYTEKELINRITEIPADTNQPFRLYAKWDSPLVYVDYTDGGVISDYDVSHTPTNGSEKTAEYKLIKGDEGNYLLWMSTGNNSTIGKNGKYALYAGESMQVTLKLTVGKDGDNPFAPIQIFLRETSVARNYFQPLWISSDGSVHLGPSASAPKFMKIADVGYTTVVVVLDFERAEIIGYDVDGNELARNSMVNVHALPSTYSSYAEWFQNFNGSDNSFINVKFCGIGNVRVAGIGVDLGNFSDECKNFGPNSNLHTWDDGVIVKDPSTTDCTPGIRKHVCTVCGTEKEVPIASSAQHTLLTHTYDKGIVTYTCLNCNSNFTIDTGYYLDGTNLNNIIGVNNGRNYKTTTGTNQPIINSDGQYELLNKSGKNGQFQLWIPSSGSTMTGFDTSRKSSGFVSFKVNALTDDSKGIGFQLVDTNSTGERWSADWCIVDSFFNISAPSESKVVTVTGWNGTVLKTVEVASKKSFTGWIDVKIFIQLDDTNDTIVLSYFIDGEYVATESKPLTTLTNGINSFYISGYTTAKGGGIMLDDIAFGFTSNGVWKQ